MNRPRNVPRIRRRQIRTVVSVATLLVAGYFAWKWLDAVGGPTALRTRLGTSAPLISVPLHVVLAATPFPSEIVGVANGRLYGLWQGTLYGWISWWTAAMIIHALARRGTHDTDTDALPTRIPKLLARLPIGHPVVLIVVRRLPFCFHALNALAGPSPSPGDAARRVAQIQVVPIDRHPPAD